MLPPSHSIVTSSMTKWTSSLPDSLANRFPSQVKEKQLTTIDGFGLPSSTSFARHHPPSSSWRTSQTSLTNMKHFLKYSQPWPRLGSMLNGSLYKRAKSVRIIKEIVCSSSLIDLNTFTFYPTPTASDGTRGSTSYGPGNLTLKGAAMQNTLHGGITKPRLSPLFVEWMMGFHTGWTDLEHSETQ
jgi:hypothetical protein